MKIKHVLTQEDFDNNPNLKDAGFSLGQQVEIETDSVISTETNSDANANADQQESDDDSGGDHPTNKPGNP